MALEFDHVTITQGTFTLTADLTIPKGKTVAIIGPSGGGKSTLLNAIAGFAPLASGRIRIDGEDMATTRPAARPVTLLFQEHNLFPHLTVFQNTALGLRPDLKLTPEDRARVIAALVETGLQGTEDRTPPALSGGQRQRVALARALLRRKPYLLLDEPFAALGPALKSEMLDLVARITAEQDMTLLMVTHSPEDTRRIASWTVLVADGTAQPPLPTEALFADPPPALRAYLGS